MVSKICRRIPKRSIKDLHAKRHRRNKKIGGGVVISSALSSINKTVYKCKKRIFKILSKLSCFNTPRRCKGYKALKNEKDPIFRKKNLLPPLLSPKKRTIVLDLDETLVHSTPEIPTTRFDFIVRPRINGEVLTFYVAKRPGVDRFLNELGDKYEVVVFTAGLKEYASLVVDQVDVNGAISHRLYRDSCKEVDGKFVKDLSELGRKLRDVLIVDDNPNCYVFQPENAIPIRPFVGDSEDGELKKLGRFLVGGCEDYEDMREGVKDYMSRLDVHVNEM